MRKDQITRYRAKSAEETRKIASKIVNEIPEGGILCLYGQLGAGKTTFAKGLASNLGMSEMLIKSPTYTYVREHDIKGKKIFHCDLYRLEGLHQYANEIIKELLDYRPRLIVIEWAEHLGNYLPKHRTDVHMKIKNGEREIHIRHL